MTIDELPKWPVERLESALSMLTGARVLNDRFEAVAHQLNDPREAVDLLQDAAASAGYEVSPVAVRGHELEEALGSGPQLVVVFMGVLVLESTKGRTAVLIDPGGCRVRVPLHKIADAVRALWAAKLGVQSKVIADRVCAGGPTAELMKRDLREVQLAPRNLEVGWRIEREMKAPLGELLRRGKHPAKLLQLVAVFAAVQLFLVLSWIILARAALSGWNDSGMMFGWCLCIGTTIALRIAASWREGLLSIELASLLKRRLMAQSSRSGGGRGIGQAMGRVLEAEVLEEFSLSGGLVSLLAVIELGFAFVLLCQVHWLPPVTFVALLWLLVAVCIRFYHRTEEWTEARLKVTHWLIERLVGSKTVELQGDPRTESVVADQLLVEYLRTSERKDSWSSISLVVLSRAPLALGFLSLLPIFFQAEPGTALWTGIGGVVLGSAGYLRLAVGLGAVCEGAVAAKRVLPDHGAEEQVPVPNHNGRPVVLAPAAIGTPLIHAQDLDFGYPNGGRVLKDVSLEIRAGDRILLQGPSGSGKSTLAALLAGAERPSSGLLLMRGLDQGSLGAGQWRRKVLSVSQFHQNHILQGSLAFNLLMGRAWPASPEDLALAQTVCEELGLGALLKRMPDGLEQTVGTTGWQLSHGERARVYLARALLQSPDLVILDESFASLDHETMFEVMACVDRRATTLLVNAHP